MICLSKLPTADW